MFSYTVSGPGSTKRPFLSRDLCSHFGSGAPKPLKTIGFGRRSGGDGRNVIMKIRRFFLKKAWHTTVQPLCSLVDQRSIKSLLLHDSWLQCEAERVTFGRERTRPASALWAIILLSACTSGGGEVFLSLQTDWRVPGDFSRVEVRYLDAALGASIHVHEADGEYFAPRSIATLEVPPGPSEIDVVLFNEDHELVRRRLSIIVEERLTHTIRLTRNCEGVLCDGSSICLGGECVAPECEHEAAGTACPAPCIFAQDCDGGIDCVEDRCIAGLCLQVPLDERCPSGRLCTVEGCEGCLDEERCQSGEDDDCDGLIDCADPDCEGARCDDGVWCNGDEVCAEGTCFSAEDSRCERPELCDERRALCLECLEDDDCGEPTYGTWSACSFGSRCAESGTRTRTVTRSRCVDNSCGPPAELAPENRNCERDTEGDACGGTSRCFGGECQARCSTGNDGSVSCATLCGWCTGGEGRCAGAATVSGGTLRNCSVRGERLYCFCTGDPD